MGLRFRLGLGLAFVAVAIGCTQAAGKKSKDDNGDTYEADPGDPIIAPPRPPDYVNDDSGAFNLGSRQGSGDVDSGPRDEDAGKLQDVHLPDGGTALCQGALQPGDLKIVELMIASTSGQGDKGEWVEVQSTKSCRLAVKGVTVDSPRGAASDTATVTDALILDPYGTFVVAGSSDPAANHGLPPPLYAWNAADVLKNDGDTINVTLGGVVIDTLTYPSFAPIDYGRSISFPADCAWSDRSSWARWSYSFTQYAKGVGDGGGFLGSPNADNFDVACY